MATVLKDSFATQSGHWYDLEGNPRYTLIGKNGKERNTTIRDAREHSLVPSVTTILKQAAAPGLVQWQLTGVAKAALALARQEGESDESYIARILYEAGEISRKARDKGTEIHGAIEKLDKTGPYSFHVYCAMDEVTKWAGIMDWDSERSFASRLGYGGKLDLSAPGFVVDFKTTDKPLDDLKTWPDHRRQLAAYRRGLDMPDARCAICYVSSGDPKARLIELSQEELEQGWQEFCALLLLWKAANKWVDK